MYFSLSLEKGLFFFSDEDHQIALMSDHKSLGVFSFYQIGFYFIFVFHSNQKKVNM